MKHHHEKHHPASRTRTQQLVRLPEYIHQPTRTTDDGDLSSTLSVYKTSLIGSLVYSAAAYGVIGCGNDPGCGKGSSSWVCDQLSRSLVGKPGLWGATMNFLNHQNNADCSGDCCGKIACSSNMTLQRLWPWITYWPNQYLPMSGLKSSNPTAQAKRTVNAIKL